jgi:nitrogen fixation protein NifB
MTPDDALDLVAAAMEDRTPPSAIEIGGPGEPLLDASTYVVLRRLRAACRDLPLAVWTNGVLLPDRLDELVRSGVTGVTLSLNAAASSAARKIYNEAIFHCRKYVEDEAADLVLRQQWEGFAAAVRAGINVTVYTAKIGKVNSRDIPVIEKRAKSIGADRVIVAPAFAEQLR